MAALIAATSLYPWLSIDMEAWKLAALTESVEGLEYIFGAKAEPLSLQAPDMAAAGIKGMDCSGFSRWAIYHATGQQLAIPDGSVEQHEWFEAQAFKASTFGDAGRADGVIRIAFLEPIGDEPGHVMILPGDGSTCESYGAHGPGRRVWGSESFMALCHVYVVTPAR